VAERENEERKTNGGNGNAETERKDGRRVHEVKLSEAVQSWVMYCGKPVTVHLKFQMLLMDYHGDVIDLPVDNEGHTIPLGIAAPALFRHVEGDKREREPMFTDTLERVFMAPAPCGKRLVLSQKTQLETGQSGAVISYIVDPEAINSVSFVDRIPQNLVATPPRGGLITPGN